MERKKAEKQVTNVKKSVVKEYEAKLKDASLDIKHKDKVIEVSLFIVLNSFCLNKYSHISFLPYTASS